MNINLLIFINQSSLYSIYRSENKAYDTHPDFLERTQVFLGASGYATQRIDFSAGLALLKTQIVVKLEQEGPPPEDNPMEKMQRQAIARAEVETGRPVKVRGTAFHVFGSYALTAYHVIADRKRYLLERGNPGLYLFPGPIVSCTSFIATLLSSLKLRFTRTILIRTMTGPCLLCDPAPPGDPLFLTEQCKKGEDWESFGFPELHAGGWG
jgi:hypothetical protein